MPLPTGSVAGSVTLNNGTGGVANPSGAINPAGVLISIDGTTFSATTDSNGRYLIANIPQGAYDITFSKIGYETFKLIDATVLAGTTPAEEETVDLFAPCVNAVTTLAVQNYILSGKIIPSFLPNSQQNIAIYYSSSNAVSSSNYNFVQFWGQTNDSTFSYEIGGLYSMYSSGSTVYIVAYACYGLNFSPANNNSSSYTSPATGKAIFSGLSATPSNVVSVTLP